MRKDASNNAANKLSQKMFAENPLEFVSAKDYQIKSLGNSATQRKREALENARASLNLLLTGSCGNSACDKNQSRDGSKQLLLCQGCRTKAYCDAACQKADWKAHKPACKEAQAKKAAEVAGEKPQETTTAQSTSSSAASSSSSSSSSSVPTSAPAPQPTPAVTAPAPTPAPAAEPTPAAAPAAVVDPSALD